MAQMSVRLYSCWYPPDDQFTESLCLGLDDFFTLGGMNPVGAVNVQSTMLLGLPNEEIGAFLGVSTVLFERLMGNVHTVTIGWPPMNEQNMGHLSTGFWVEVWAQWAQGNMINLRFYQPSRHLLMGIVNDPHLNMQVSALRRLGFASVVDQDFLTVRCEIPFNSLVAGLDWEPNYPIHGLIAASPLLVRLRLSHLVNNYYVDMMPVRWREEVTNNIADIFLDLELSVGVLVHMEMPHEDVLGRDTITTLGNIVDVFYCCRGGGLQFVFQLHQNPV